MLFFSGLFVAYGVYRANHYALFHYAHHFLDWRMGALNTVVLVGSSVSAAWSVRCAQLGQRGGLRISLLLTLLLAGVFLVVKYFEYSHKLHNGIAWGAACKPSAEILASLPPAMQALPVPKDLGTFFSIYYLMTGLHGIHVLVGMGLYVWLIRRAGRGDFVPGYYVPVDAVALYWHLVDMILDLPLPAPLPHLIGAAVTEHSPSSAAPRSTGRTSCPRRCSWAPRLPSWRSPSPPWPPPASTSGEWNVVLALAIACTKAALVALFFMHLKYENRFQLVVLASAALFAALFVAFVVFDTTQYQPDIRAAETQAAPKGS